MGSVYVLIALEDGKVKECIVLDGVQLDNALEIREKLITIYGSDNVAFVSRAVGDIPPIIFAGG